MTQKPNTLTPKEARTAVADSALFLTRSMYGVPWPSLRPHHRSPCTYGVTGTPGTAILRVRTLMLVLNMSAGHT